MRRHQGDDRQEHLSHARDRRRARGRGRIAGRLERWPGPGPVVARRARRRHRSIVAAAALILTTGVAAAPARAITPTITEFNAGLTPGGGPIAIAAGPDGNLWFLEYANPGRIGKITPAGAIAEVATGGVTPGFTANSQPSVITAGPDGNVWFTEGRNPGGIGEVNPATGTVTEVATGGVTPGFTANRGPQGIVAGPDGNLWFAEDNNPGAIGRITPAGTVTEFITGLTPNSGPDNIAVGADGKLWFTEVNPPNRIGRIDPGTGAISEFPPAGLSGVHLYSIAAGPGGNVWFTDFNPPGRIGEITPAGVITEVATGGVTLGFTVNSQPSGIAAGPDGSVWFTEQVSSIGPARIARFDPATGTVQEFPTPTPNSAPDSIAVGPDGNLWFTEFGGAIGRITTPPTATTATAAATGATSATVGGLVNGHAQATSFHVEYGPLGQATTATPEQTIGVTHGGIAVSRALSGLRPSTTYQARVVVTNPTGSTDGAFLTLKTAGRPVLTKVSQSHRKWRRGGALPHVSRAHKPPVGTIFSFVLNEPARVIFTFTQPGVGRRAGHRCTAVTRSNRHKGKCALTVASLALGSLAAGRHHVSFDGRSSRSKKLRPGRYTLVITAVNPARQQSAPVLLRFTIVPG